MLFICSDETGQETPLAGLTETAVASHATGRISRLSTAGFPLHGAWDASEGGSLGGAKTFTVRLGYNQSTNPFVHTYHPDHDNMDARFERVLPAGQESFDVTRVIKLTFQSNRPRGAPPLSWGTSVIGGIYEETVTGLRAHDVRISGPFILHRVSGAAALSE